MVKTKAKLR